MTDKVDKRDCTGCGACAAVCPKNAISLREDEDGFRYPVIDSGLCVGCQSCEKTCPALHPAVRNEPLEVFAAAAAEDRVLMQSASGGAFTALAESVLRQGGVVYGCAMEQREDGNPGLFIRHIRVDAPEDLPSLSGSKYAQSRTEKAFRQIRNDLLEGRTVLFGGTPCQCAGLQSFLQTKAVSTDHLFTADILCHGIPSERLFRKYLSYMEKKYGGKITAYQFRDKERGYTYYPKLCVRKGQKEKWIRLSVMEEGYWYIFQQSLANRESCYSCPYSSARRCGDVSLGDFWGIEQAHPELLAGSGGPLQREKGISLLLVNTDKGMRLVNTCGEKLKVYNSTLEKAMEKAAALKPPGEKPADREKVLALLHNGYAGIAEYAKKSMGAGYLKSIMKDKVKGVLRG